jgi:hypothetical protein
VRRSIDGVCPVARYGNFAAGSVFGIGAALAERGADDFADGFGFGGEISAGNFMGRKGSTCSVTRRQSARSSSVGLRDRAMKSINSACRPE